MAKKVGGLGTSFLLRSMSICKSMEKDVNDVSKWDNADINEYHHEPPDAWVILTSVHWNHRSQPLGQKFNSVQPKG